MIRGVRRRRESPEATKISWVGENTRANDRPDDRPTIESRKKPAHVGHAEKSPTKAPNEPSQPEAASACLFLKAKTVNDTFRPTSQEIARRRIASIGMNKMAMFWVR